MTRAQLEQMARAAAARNNVDPDIFVKLIRQESGFDPNIVNPKSGATGLGQLMADTATSLGVTDRRDPVQNLEGSARYLRQQLEHYNAQTTVNPYALALAAYNAGPGAVQKYNGIPPFKETQAYVRAILGNRSPAGGDVFDEIPGSQPVRRPSAAVPPAGDVFSEIPGSQPAPAHVLTTQAAFDAIPGSPAKPIRPSAGHPTFNFSGLSDPLINPSLKAAVSLAVTEAEKQGLSPVLTSGVRSQQKQASLYQDWLNGKSLYPAAPPGRSEHETGNALDIKERHGRQEQLAQIFARYGLTRPVKNDPLHFHYDPAGDAIQAGVEAGQRAQAQSEAQDTDLLLHGGTITQPTTDGQTITSRLPAFGRPGQTDQQVLNAAALARRNRFQNTPDSLLETTLTGVGPALGGVLHGLGALNSAKNAFLNTYLAPRPDRGSDLLHPQTAVTDLVPAAQAAGRALLADDPTALHVLSDNTGIHLGKSSPWTAVPVRAADWLADLFTDPANVFGPALDHFLLAPAGRLVGGKLAAGSERLFTALETQGIRSRLGAKLPVPVANFAGLPNALEPAKSSVLPPFLERLGYGPGARATAGVQRYLDQELSPRLYDLGQTMNELRQEVVRRRIGDPVFDQAVKAYEKEANRGLIQDYIRQYVNHIDHPEDLAELLTTHIPANMSDLVQKYGDRIVQHATDAAGIMEQALGHDLYTAILRTPMAAENLVAKSPRELFLARYAERLFGRSRGQWVGDLGHAAFAANDVQTERYAALLKLTRTLRQDADGLFGPSRIAAPLLPGAAPRPGWVRIPTLWSRGEALRRRYLEETGKALTDEQLAALLPPTPRITAPLEFSDEVAPYQVPRAVGRFLERMEQGFRSFPETPTVGEGLEFDPTRGPIRAPLQQAVDQFKNAALDLVGLRKQLLIGNPATVAGNLGGNLTLSFLAAMRSLRSAGIRDVLTNPAENVGRLMAWKVPETVKEMVAFARKGTLSPEMRELGPVFHNTLASTAAIARGKTAQEVAGTAGRRVALGSRGIIVPETAHEVGRAFWNSPLAPGGWVKANQWIEQSSKLLLYKALKPTLGEFGAKQAVKKYLFDYSDRTWLMEALDRTGLYMFNTFPLKAQALFLDTLAHRPDLIARYPNLRRALLTETGAKANEAEQRPDSQSQYVLPTGPQSGVDVGRWLPFSQIVGSQGELNPGGVDVGLKLTPEDGLRLNANPLDLLPEALGHTAAGSLLGLAFNQKTLSPGRPVVLPGLTNEAKHRELLDQVAKSLLPLYLNEERIRAAAQGETFTDGKYTGRQSLGDAVLQGGLGLRPIDLTPAPAHGPHLNAAAVEARKEAADRYRRQIDADLVAGRLQNPFMGRITEADPETLRQWRLAADAAQTNLIYSGENVDGQNRLTARGKERVKEQELYRAALLAHIHSVAARLQQRAAPPTVLPPVRR